MGHGKPLGFGSIAVKVDSVKLLKYGLSDEKSDDGFILRKEDNYKYSVPEFDKTIEKWFNQMTCFEALNNKCIAYSSTKESSDESTEEGNAIFEWFGQNHLLRNYRGGKLQCGTSKMGRFREQMMIKEYMQPMIPELCEVEESKEIADNRKGN